jgi:acetylornithine deacetylase/succinyl-diaminopimelate desuccinylase-like protein
MTIAAIDCDAVTREATDALSHYVQIDSSHPAGRTVETAAFLTERLEADGIPYRTYTNSEPGKVNLVSRLSADKPVGKPLLLSHHMDVVQAIAVDWRFDPYSGEVADGNVFGRGSLDDKGMGIMELMTMLLLKRQNANLSRDVIMLATCDEEIGSPMGARWMVENHFADLDPEYVLDEGGEGRRGFYSADDAFEIVVDEKRMVRIRLRDRDHANYLCRRYRRSLFPCTGHPVIRAGTRHVHRGRPEGLPRPRRADVDRESAARHPDRSRRDVARGRKRRLGAPRCAPSGGWKH